ncbi:MAG: TatD family deoxyribonuclease [Bacteroidetes bacterium]|nr:MAG: TatD family deoxyribonuclease [Bacteroidota bacterium]
MFVNIHTHKKQSANLAILNADLTAPDSGVFSCGIHPWNMDPLAHLNRLEHILTHERCVALGECGLDKLKGPDLSLQEASFNAQLQLAMKFDLPCIIHCVRSYDELIRICNQLNPKSPLIIHGFNKSKISDRLIKKGFYLSFGHDLLTNISLQEAFKDIPLDRIFLENDDSSIEIEKIYECAANLKELTLQEMQGSILKNTKQVFRKWQIG